MSTLAARVPTAATTYSPIPVPSAAELHLLNRFTYGYTPALYADVRRAGSARAWFEQQLNPSAVPDPEGDTIVDWFPASRLTPPEAADQIVNNPGTAHQAMAHATWMRVRSTRQVREILTQFWRNLFYVSTSNNKGSNHFVFAVDRAVRAVALTDIRTVMRTAVLDGSMLIYLDAHVSTKQTPNQNLAREILELHTVGVGNYSQSDVLNLSLLLTGFKHSPQGVISFDPAAHATGRVTVKGWTYANTDPSEQAVRAAVRSLLDYLALHPATRYRICRRLAVKFVQDDPPGELVSAMMATYQATLGSVPALLRTLVDRPEFHLARGRKVRTPIEDVVGIARGTVRDADGPHDDPESGIYSVAWKPNEFGEGVWLWVMPNGYREDNGPWSSPQRLLRAAQLHARAFGGRWLRFGSTLTGMSCYEQADFVPAGVTTYAELVDALARRLVGQAAGPGSTILTACCAITGLTADQPVTPTSLSEDTFSWTFSTIYDSPQWIVK